MEAFNGPLLRGRSQAPAVGGVVRVPGTTERCRRALPVLGFAVGYIR